MRLGNRKACPFDVLADPFGVHERVIGILFPYITFAAVDVHRHQHCVTGANGHRDVGFIHGSADEPRSVVPADAGNETNVVTKQRHREVQPNPGRHLAIEALTAEQDLLAREYHVRGVLDVMVKGVAVGDVPESLPCRCGCGLQVGVARMPEHRLTGALQVRDHLPDNDCCYVEHKAKLPAKRIA